jgi:hypothetical protein
MVDALRQGIPAAPIMVFPAFSFDLRVNERGSTREFGDFANGPIRRAANGIAVR